MIKFFLSKANTGKFRFFIIETNEQWNDEQKGYIIQRSYGQVNGKTTLSPEIIVGKKPKSKTWQEQLKLKFDSECKKVLDKGYKECDKHPNEYSEEELSEIYGSVATNQYGVIKPMLAKQESKLTNRKILDKIWMASRKLDGVRCLMYWDGKEVRTASRGGEHYDYATEHIRKNETLVDFLKTNPSVILDGELYRHGKTLQQISGAARMEKNAYDCDWLQYWIYDCYDKVNPEKIAKERIAGLEGHLKAHFKSFGVANDEDDILLVDHIEVSREDKIWNLHDEWVAEGFEGCVIRNPDKPYKPNGRTNDMIKFKNYKSEDFKIIGYELGTRGSEDMTFVCELPDGRTFKAMPVGDRAVKEEYVENFEEKYKGHLAECTYFNYSNDGIPTQPKLRTFRFDLE